MIVWNCRRFDKIYSEHFGTADGFYGENSGMLDVLVLLSFPFSGSFVTVVNFV